MIKNKQIKDISGNKYSRLTVIRFVFTKNGRSYWLCKCDCGNEKIIRKNGLSNGTKSCGCLNKEIISSQSKSGIEKLKTHGGSGKNWHRLYNTWNQMKQRCFNPDNKDYHRYGGRGITVCERWLNFALFVEDVYPTFKEGLTLDRFPNPDGNYEPGNFRWATMKEQNKNRSSRVK